MTTEPDTTEFRPRTDSQPYRLLPVEPEEGSTDLFDGVRFFKRHASIILGSGLGLALLAALFFGLLVGPAYRASATLILMPSQLSSDLIPPAMTIQGYQRLLESSAVIDETSRRAREALGETKVPDLAVGDELSSRIFVSRLSEDTPVAPVIEVISELPDAEIAAEVTNIWASVFLEWAKRLREGSLNESISVVESLYQDAAVSVVSHENELLSAEKEFRLKLAELKKTWRGRLSETRDTWETKITELKAQTQEAISQYQVNTRAMIEGVADWDSDAIRKLASDPDLREEVTARIAQIASIRTQLAQTLEIVSLKKGMSNDALWQAAILEQAGTLDEGQQMWDSTLINEEINPTHVDLEIRVSQLEVDLEERTDIDRQVLQEILGNLEKSQRIRAAGLISLMEGQSLQMRRSGDEMATELKYLQLDRAREIDDLTQRRDVALEEIRRRLADSKSLYSEMSLRYNQVTMARAQQDLADVRLGAAAVPPSEPESSSLMLKTLLAFFAGSLFGIFAGIVREIA